MHALVFAAALLVAALPAMAGEPSPAVPNRTSVGPFVSPSIDVRAANTAPQNAGPAGLWIGNRTIAGGHAPQAPAFGLLPPCSPGSGPCNFETTFPDQGGNE